MPYKGSDKHKAARKAWNLAHRAESLEYSRQCYWRKTHGVAAPALKRGQYPTKQRILKWAKLLRGCDKCGYHKCDKALEYHHVHGEKLFHLVPSNGCTWEKIEAEMAKCELLCANCHRETHNNSGEPA